ncbi:hypothetical protein ACLOJK_018651 [Asimina triloba]
MNGSHVSHCATCKLARRRRHGPRSRLPLSSLPSVSFLSLSLIQFIPFFFLPRCSSRRSPKNANLPPHLCCSIAGGYLIRFAAMKGHDLINSILPDELIIEVFRRLDSYKSTIDACSLVCRRWLKLQRASRRTVRIGASGNPDSFVRLLMQRFTAVRNVYIDERLPISSSFPSTYYARHVMPRPSKRRRSFGKKARGASSKTRHVEENNGPEDSEAEAFSLSDAGLTALAEGCAKLEKLSLIWCSNVTSAGLISIAMSCGCYVGDQGLAAAGEYCKHLEELNLRFCEGLTDMGLTELAIGCGKSLKVLGIAACAKITDLSLEAVGSHCTSLQNLSLDSEFIKNKGVLAVVRGCRALKALKLQCQNVTDESLQAVGTYCLSLELLALYNFQRFTDRWAALLKNSFA